ncbi:Predicted DNA binding protein, contains HTH domain [Haloarcula vallismortis]|uniref:Predicted DNA binding protein, contains HTH domain n=2 Tax=Haloarcula vallismortis TaxID=28442 RepID=A0A1H2RQ67_HALVA|nr:helix-turn-helix domain-containing protein [Haloarcula vallismortis]EMA10801.1 putative DNA binding protein [Haloarcula vallismortis ATCC 29715]SDW21435.1 Predicted DNA binding protein, contains HTH domain [Haloarcula vallismortis]
MIVEFHIDAPLLQRTAETLSKAAIRIQRLHCESGDCRAVAWIGPVERPAIEANLAQDESITDYAHVAAEGDGHWYTLHTTDTTIDAIGEALLNADGFLLGAAQTGEDWVFRARFPEKSSVLSFRDALVSSDITIDIQTITDDTEASPQFGVTDPQREVLLLALNRGYFTVPRESSLSDLAAELGISSQAASERLRRGTRTLVQNTLAAPERPLVGSPPE